MHTSPTPRAIRGLLLAWLLLTAAGIYLTSLPDQGPPLVRFSAEHGPSAHDLTGIAAVVLAQSGLWGILIARRGPLAGRLAQRPGALGVLSAVAGFGAGLVAASVFSDFALWWLVGAAVLQGVVLIVLGVAVLASGQGG